MPAPKRMLRYRQQRLLIAAFEQLSLLLDSGLSMRSALQVITAQTHDKVIQQIFQIFAQTINQGLPLHRANAQLPVLMPVAITGYLQLAEQSGQFGSVITHMVEEFHHADRQRKTIITAVRYPVAILSLSVIISTGLLVFVLPQFTALFGINQLPALTRTLLGLSSWLSRHGLELLLVLVLAILLGGLARRYFQRLWQRSLRSLPLFGPLLEQIRQQQLFHRLALLQAAGMSAVAAIQLCGNSSRWLKTRHDCTRLATLIADGNAWSVALKQIGLNQPLTEAYISTGEQTGRIDFMMNKLAQQLADDVRRRSHQLIGMIQPLLMLSLGGIIGVILLAMYLPIFTLGQQF